MLLDKQHFFEHLLHSAMSSIRFDKQKSLRESLFCVIVSCEFRMGFESKCSFSRHSNMPISWERWWQLWPTQSLKKCGIPETWKKNRAKVRKVHQSALRGFWLCGFQLFFWGTLEKSPDFCSLFLSLFLFFPYQIGKRLPRLSLWLGWLKHRRFAELFISNFFGIVTDWETRILGSYGPHQSLFAHFCGSKEKLPTENQILPKKVTKVP